MKSQQHLDGHKIKYFLKVIQSHGFTYTVTKRRKFRFQPPANIGGPFYSTHLTRSSIYAVQREFKKIYSVHLDIDPKYFV